MNLKAAFIVLCMNLGMLYCEEQMECCCGPQHMYIGARYTTPKGVGYHKSYTTLEGFFAPPNFLCGTWLPFLDVRGHVFNNGKWAANAGLGLRWLAQSRFWGVNAYYDYRNSSHAHYNQVAAGFETLGTIWDFRINGYLPVGEKQSHRFHRSAVFQDNFLLIRYSRFFAMKGANAEIGAHINCNKAPLYFAGGPYYLTAGKKRAWGGEIRARIDLFCRYLRIEGNTSYDHLFKWIGQAQISVNIPLGKRSNPCCCPTEDLLERAAQRVDRFEIIAEIKQKTVTPATTPATGQPWLF